MIYDSRSCCKCSLVYPVIQVSNLSLYFQIPNQQPTPRTGGHPEPYVSGLSVSELIVKRLDTDTQPIKPQGSTTPSVYPG